MAQFNLYFMVYKGIGPKGQMLYVEGSSQVNWMVAITHPADATLGDPLFASRGSRFEQVSIFCFVSFYFF
jgi:hypothetical protein